MTKQAAELVLDSKTELERMKFVRAEKIRRKEDRGADKSDRVLCVRMTGRAFKRKWGSGCLRSP